MKLILLPGLDGTGDLFAPFVEHAPSQVDVMPRALPLEGAQSYYALVSSVGRSLPQEPLVLLGESFSGPLALLLAHTLTNVTAVVLCSSFVTSPIAVPRVRIPKWFGRPAPRFVLRHWLTGGDAELAERVHRASMAVSSETIVARLKAATQVDVIDHLRRLRQPLLDLRGSRDRLVGPRCARLVRATKPGAVFAELDAPHMVLQTKPRESWEVISGFLAGLA